MNQTQKNSLNKPTLSDLADITEISNNFTKIDDGLVMDVGTSYGDKPGEYHLSLGSVNLVNGNAIRFYTHKATTNIPVLINGIRLFELSGNVNKNLAKNVPYMVMYYNNKFYLMNSSWFDAEALVSKVDNFNVDINDFGLTDELINMLKKLKNNGNGERYLNDKGEYTDPLRTNYWSNDLILKDSGGHFKLEMNIAYRGGICMVRAEITCYRPTNQETYMGNISRSPFYIIPVENQWATPSFTYDSRCMAILDIYKNGNVYLKNGSDMPSNTVYAFCSFCFAADCYYKG